MNSGIIAQNDRIVIRRTTLADIPYVLKQEGDPAHAPFIGQWSEQQHRAALDDADCEHWMIETQPGGKVVGFVILRGLAAPHRSIEIMRIVIAEKSQGIGRETLRLLKRIAFEQLHAHRLWLDVRGHNTRARTLYESEGFVVEGTLRECQRWGDRYFSLVVLSILEQEWRAHTKTEQLSDTQEQPLHYLL